MLLSAACAAGAGASPGDECTLTVALPGGGRSTATVHAYAFGLGSEIARALAPPAGAGCAADAAGAVAAAAAFERGHIVSSELNMRGDSYAAARARAWVLGRAVGTRVCAARRAQLPSALSLRRVPPLRGPCRARDCNFD